MDIAYTILKWQAKSICFLSDFLLNFNYVLVYLLYIIVKLDLDFTEDFMDDRRITKMVMLSISRN